LNAALSGLVDRADRSVSLALRASRAAVPSVLGLGMVNLQLTLNKRSRATRAHVTYDL
jgi:hypothetical protein